MYSAMGASPWFPRQGTLPAMSRCWSMKNSGLIMLSGDVVHLEENFEKNIVPSLNTNKAESIASMEKVRQLIAAYKATFFINHEQKPNRQA